MGELDLFSEGMKGLVEMANRVQEQLRNVAPDQRWQMVQQTVADCDVVFAVWQDKSAKNGVGFEIIKGQALLRKSASGTTVKSTRVAAIPCIEREQAKALLKVAGERVWLLP